MEAAIETIKTHLRASGCHTFDHLLKPHVKTVAWFSIDQRYKDCVKDVWSFNGFRVKPLVNPNGWFKLSLGKEHSSETYFAQEKAFEEVCSASPSEALRHELLKIREDTKQAKEAAVKACIQKVLSDWVSAVSSAKLFEDLSEILKKAAKALARNVFLFTTVTSKTIEIRTSYYDVEKATRLTDCVFTVQNPFPTEAHSSDMLVEVLVDRICRIHQTQTVSSGGGINIGWSLV